MPSALRSGSCGLEYRLVEVPKTLRDDYTDGPSSWTALLNRGCSGYHRLLDGRLTKLQRTSSFRPFLPSFGSLCSSTSHTPSFGTSFCPANGVAPVVLSRGTAVPVLVHGVQVSEVDLTGSTDQITVVVLHRLPLPTRRVDLLRRHLKDKAEGLAFGRVWRQVV